LKSEKYKAEDWRWLIAKYDKRIGHWCNRWLSLGGCFVLIKVVLESQPVYWMALAAIPVQFLTGSDSYFFLFFGRVVVKKIIFIFVDGRLLLNQRFMEDGV
jgi:hypothetical protein